jgi:DNA-binding transcriptional MerR regulator
MTTFSQISMKFVEESALPKDEQEIQTVKEDMPVNVGIRIKKLKTETAAPQQIATGVAETALVIADDNKPEVLVSAEPAQKIKSGRGRKSIRQIAEEADLIQIPEDEILFLKQYYTMGEVADMFRVNQSLLRFWEAEFSILQPKKNKKGDRYFRPVDVKNLHLIYHLLRQRKYTIEGAKDFLKKNHNAEEKFETIRKLEEVKRFLLEMKANLR